MFFTIGIIRALSSATTGTFIALAHSAQRTLFALWMGGSGIEVKQARSRSDYQKEFRKNLEAAGGRYILVHSLDDVIWQLPR
jgi:hypothetical protein